MDEVVYVVIKQCMGLCRRLMPVFNAAFLGGWALFKVGQGASPLWLALPLVLLGMIVWWVQQW